MNYAAALASSNPSQEGGADAQSWAGGVSSEWKGRRTVFTPKIWQYFGWN